MINPVSRITGLVLRPKKTFEDAKDDPLVFVFSLYLLIVFLSFVLKLIVSASYLSVAPQLREFLFMEAAFSFLFSIVGALVGTGMLAIVTRIAGKRQTLRPAARVFLYAGIPLALVLLVVNGITGPLVYRGSPFASWVSSAGLVLVIAVYIWTIVLVITGLRAIFGLPTVSAAVCAVAGLSAAALVSLIYSSGSLMLVPVQLVVARFLAIPLILAVVFGLYYLLESRQLVQEQRGRWELTQLYSWGAIAALILSFLYLPLYRHGGYTEGSQLSMSLQMLTQSPYGTASTMGMQELEIIAIIGLMIVIFFLHGIGIAGRKIPILSFVLSLIFLAISFSYIAGWQTFHHYMDSLPVQPDWGTWIVPLTGLIYLLIVVFYKETPPAGNETRNE